MTKKEFLLTLEKRLKKLPKTDRDNSLDYYSEIIDDRIEEGLTEEVAVARLGSLDNIVKDILSNVSLTKIVIENVKPKRKMSVLEIILIVLGSPIWLALIISLFAVVISVYAVIWSVAISIYAVNISLLAIGICGVPLLIVGLLQGNVYVGVFYLCASLVCFGLGLLFINLSVYLTKFSIYLTKITLNAIKFIFVSKGDK